MMDIKTFLDNIHEDVCCPVCKTRFTNPKQLPCLHSFCLHCLQRIQQTSGIRDTISCPECRRNFRIPGNGDLNAFQANVCANSLLDALPVTECNTSGIKCGFCEKVTSGESAYCFTCCSFWCDNCLPLHNRFKAFKEHNALALKDFRDEDFENILKQPTLSARVKSDVQRFADSFIAAIEAQKNHIFDEVENKVRESLQLLEEQRHEIEEDVKMQEADIEKTQMILKRSTNAQIMQPHAFLDKIVQEKAEEDSADCDIGHVMTIVFKRNEKLFDDLKVQQLGFIRIPGLISKTSSKKSSAEGKGVTEETVGLEAEIVVTTRNTQREQCYQEHDRVTLEIRNCEGRDSAIKPHIQDNKDGTYKVSYFSKETGAFQASVKVNGEHVRGSPFEVHIKRRHFRPVLSFGKSGSDAGMLSSPWGVAVNDNDEIAVSECNNNRVQIFASNGTRLRSFGKKGNQQGEFNFPAGIAFHDNKIIVADVNNHRVQLFSDEGHYLNQFGGKGSRDHQLQSPYGLSIDSDGNIMVADSGNKLIKIFSLDGLFLRSIGTEGSFINLFHCIQHVNHLIVSDRGDHCIKVFNREGEFLYKFGNKGMGDGELNNPCCLSVDRAGHLLVCDTSNDRVQVFKLSGEFVTKFEEKGTGTGELFRPISTAVLNDGKIIVTEWINHRVNIFE
ncbi:tripartite motif-containing protein 2-like [Montipora capricornis]|uniref:tripartite motif-containing protein 2-like n=1 Tax=Montipora capricornis TaxID=246305 RepID=UPI0035F137B9